MPRPTPHAAPDDAPKPVLARRYINVAYRDRELARDLGALWDPSVNRWYCPPGSRLAKVFSWRKVGVDQTTPIMDQIAARPKKRRYTMNSAGGRADAMFESKGGR